MVMAHGCRNQPTASLCRHIAHGCAVSHWDVLSLYGLQLPYERQFW